MDNNNQNQNQNTSDDSAIGEKGGMSEWDGVSTEDSSPDMDSESESE